MRASRPRRTPRVVIASGVFCRELIGRASELAFLHERALRREARTSAALVVRGEAGIGKTRIVDELLRAASADGVLTACAAAHEYANAPYAVVEAAIAPLGVGVPAAFDETERDGRSRRFNAIADALDEVASRAPRGVLVAIEDLHWADVATIDLLRFLAQRLARAPVTFVVTYRVEDVEDEGARARAVAALERAADGTVTLDALSSRDIDRLLGTVMRDAARPLPRDVVTRISELSDGRPLFAEELLRGVFERIDRDSRAEPTVPGTIRATVRERFATLPEPDRTIVLHAALIGRRFSAQFVAAFSGHALGEVYAALRRARDLQLVLEQPDETGDAFAFRHALTREAVYGELLRAEARLMHGKVAAALAAHPAPEAAQVADHFHRAGDVEAAAQWSERAGDEAFAVFAYEDAARAYERAFALALDDVRRGSLAQRAADALYALGDLAPSVEWLARAAAAYEAAGDARRMLRCALRRARVLFEAGRYEAGRREAERLAATADAEPELRFEALMMVAGLLTTHGQDAPALQRLAEAEAIGVPSDPYAGARFEATYGMALAHLGHAQAARARYEAAVRAARAAGDHDQVLRTLNNWGNLEIACGTLDRATERYAETLGIAEHTKNVRILAWSTQNAALVRLLAGDFAGARALLGRVATVEHGLPIAHRWTTALLLRIDTLEGRLAPDDVARTEEVLDAAIDDVDVNAVGALAAALAHRLAAENRLREAGEVLARVVPLFDAFEAPFWLADAASRYGDRPARERAREILAASAALPGMAPARARLALVDAREAARRPRRSATPAGSSTRRSRSKSPAAAPTRSRSFGRPAPPGRYGASPRPAARRPIGAGRARSPSGSARSPISSRADGRRARSRRRSSSRNAPSRATSRRCTGSSASRTAARSKRCSANAARRRLRSGGAQAPYRPGCEVRARRATVVA
jgi:tetratricopeptide (TPR) repeat protein